jgi:putative redox protein
MEMTISFGGNKKINAQIGEYTVQTDQPVQGGGDNSAPSPYLLFLASLGTCAGVYVLSFLESRGLSTEGVTLTQKHLFDPMTNGLAGVDLEVNLPDTIPTKYHNAIIRSAGMCAVKKTLANPPEISVTVQPTRTVQPIAAVQPTA